MVKWASRLAQRFQSRQASTPSTPTSQHDQSRLMAVASSLTFSALSSLFGGEKYPGGLGGLAYLDQLDYWTLRAHSIKLFTENPYAMGIVNRLVTHEIGTGLALESTPAGSILGLDPTETTTLSDMLEARYRLWSRTPSVCDYHGISTFGQLEQIARRCALISGDVLAIIRTGPTGLPNVQLIDGIDIRSPALSDTVAAARRRGNVIVDGVELDANNNHVAYYIVKRVHGTGALSETLLPEQYERIPAYGERTGRRTAKLVYGMRRKITDVRGFPLLTCLLQSLKELDRYKDAEQRAAVVNSILAMFIKKTEDRVPTRGILGSGILRGSTEVTQPDDTTRKFDISSMYPGVVLEELAKGEEPVSFDTKRPSANFAVFETAIVNAMSWALELPPTVLRLAFTSSWSASKSEINMLRAYLDKSRQNISDDFNAEVYFEWLLSSALQRSITLPGFLAAYRSGDWMTVAAWKDAQWAGVLLLGVDKLQEVKAEVLMVQEGFSTRERASRLLTNTKFSANVARAKAENEALAEAMQPLIDVGLAGKQKADTDPASGKPTATDMNTSGTMLHLLEKN